MRKGISFRPSLALLPQSVNSAEKRQPTAVTSEMRDAMESVRKHVANLERGTGEASAKQRSEEVKALEKE